ncbi:MAG: methyl-accepting chemotaxis protein [Anaerobutyricum hallii]|uniref:methyl-accepting chemotaxis protein n=1 Tax=Anaerobutyricum hallii TaxID=39488 RepID=UPI00242AE22B|nr:methyl-accepting chemotaxis protein [Anaerobutyricum hallii]MDD6588335.1 methyl-accepting chemotaxis protein [Anaerobutyricum hallii]
MRLTIRKKLLLCSILPISVLGIIIVFMSLTFLRNSIINQVENSLRGTAAATLAAYDQNSGTYLVAENGDVWKGGYNISNSEKLLDTIKEKSGMDVTFFYGNKRIMTSIKEQSGERILGSPAGSKIEEMVLQNGKEYFSKNVSVDGVMYFGYYVPVFQGDDSNEPVGMVFAGINKNETLYSVLRIVFYMTVIVLVIAIIGIVGAGLISNTISRVLKSEITSLEYLAMGNLNVQIDKKNLQRKDEIGDLSRAIDTLKTDLRSVIGGISESTNLLISSSDSLEQTSHQTFENMDYVMQSVDTITTSAISQAKDTKSASDNITHMGNLIIETGSEADLLNKNADKMLIVSDKTTFAIDELKKISEEVGSSVNIIAELTEQTNESAKTIREAAEFISGIADETNLLSLNASIEAARAGEAGKGFAVVADEIQKLAVQSNEASSRIDKIVNTLIVDAEHVVDSMEQMKSVIGKQNEYIKSTEESVSEVMEEINESIEKIRNIEKRTQDLETARKEMMGMIAGLSDIADSNVVNTHETSKVINDVSDRFKKVEESAVNLRVTADILEQNMKIFKM